MTMLDMLESMLPYSLKIERIVENPTSYSIRFSYEKDKNPTVTRAELPKAILPGTDREICGYTVCTAMAAIMMQRNDLSTAQEWIDMITSGEYKKLGFKSKGLSVCKLVTRYINSQRCFHYETLHEFVETYEDADLLAQYEMQRKSDDELIFIFPGSNRGLTESEIQQVKKLLEKYKESK